MVYKNIWSILIVFYTCFQGCHGYSYNINGLVAASACAIILLIVVIFVSILASVWADVLHSFYKKRGVPKSPRIMRMKIARRKVPHSMSKQEIQLQVLAQQKTRPRLPNTWRGVQQQEQNGFIRNSEKFSTGDFHFGVETFEADQYATVKPTPVVMEIHDETLPRSVRNYADVMDLPEENTQSQAPFSSVTIQPAQRVSRNSQGVHIDGEMVEIQPENVEKSTQF